jgi:hypothetical protein
MSRIGSSPPRYRLTFDPRKLSNALWISPEAVLEEFRDGRVSSRFAEHWVAALYKVTKSENTNQPGHDGVISHPLTGEWRVSVKSLTKSGVKFQHSRYVGSGRGCTVTDLRRSLEDADFVIAVDIRDFPVVRTVPVGQRALLDLVDAQCLTPTGLRPAEFYRQLAGGPPESLAWTDVAVG